MSNVTTNNNATVNKNDLLTGKTATIVEVEGLNLYEIIDNEGWCHKIWATSYSEACKMLRESVA